MAYTISLSNGTSLLGTTGLGDGSVDSTSTSLSLIGKNYPSYGQLLNENFVHLLENFANSEAPNNTIPGQIWWDTSSKVLKLNIAATVDDTANWKNISTMFVESSVSSINGTPATGDFWYDAANKQLRVYTGSITDGLNGWILVGPLVTASNGATGAIPDTLTDTVGDTHVVIKFFVDGVLTGIFSNSSDFALATSITGWGTSTIRKGLNLAPNLGSQYYGNANVAINVWNNGTITSGDKLLTTDSAVTSNVTLSTNSNDGLRIGSSGNLVANISSSVNGFMSAGNPSLSSAYSGYIGMTTAGKDLVVYVNKSGTGLVPIFQANASAQRLRLYQAPSSDYDAATKAYVDSAVSGGVSGISGYLKLDGTTSMTGDLLPTGNVSLNLGSTSHWWNNIYGTAVHAKYADLAERFESDQPYAAGTVVELGGPAEIMAVQEDLSDNVFGVVSTRAAYLMNSGSGTDETHPPVAVSGRVPVNVIGKIRKGDRLVSAGNGCARAAHKNEITPWNVIGRALENKNDTGPGVIEAIVKLAS